MACIQHTRFAVPMESSPWTVRRDRAKSAGRVIWDDVSPMAAMSAMIEAKYGSSSATTKLLVVSWENEKKVRHAWLNSHGYEHNNRTAPIDNSISTRDPPVRCKLLTREESDVSISEQTRENGASVHMYQQPLSRTCMPFT